LFRREDENRANKTQQELRAESTHHHPLELEAGLADAELELLDDVGDLLEAVDVRVRHFGGVRDDQERLPLEQDHLVRPTGRTQDKTAEDEARRAKTGQKTGKTGKTGQTTKTTQRKVANTRQSCVRGRYVFR